MGAKSWEEVKKGVPIKITSGSRRESKTPTMKTVVEGLFSYLGNCRYDPMCRVDNNAARLCRPESPQEVSGRSRAKLKGGGNKLGKGADVVGKRRKAEGKKRSQIWIGVTTRKCPLAQGVR